MFLCAPDMSACATIDSLLQLHSWCYQHLLDQVAAMVSSPSQRHKSITPVSHVMHSFSTLMLRSIPSSLHRHAHGIFLLLSCRWCVTGTPVGTDIGDLKGQFNFLQLHPFTNKNFFNMYVKSAYAGSSWARGPAYVVLYMLGQCMIRHTKLQVSVPEITNFSYRWFAS